MCTDTLDLPMNPVVPRYIDPATIMTRSVSIAISLLGLLLATSGCRTPATPQPPSVDMQPQPMPHELCKTVLPPYVIEPPDILLIEAVRIVPKAPYHLKTADVLDIEVAWARPPTCPSWAASDRAGRIGSPRGALRRRDLAHLTVEEAEKASASTFAASSTTRSSASALPRSPASSRLPASTLSVPTAPSRWACTAMSAWRA